jgi:hypothetical protein
MKNQANKCIELLELNGWDKLKSDGYISMFKNNAIGVDFDYGGHMYFIGYNGNFLTKKIDYYTLIGVLIHYRQLPINFKEAKPT